MSPRVPKPINWIQWVTLFLAGAVTFLAICILLLFVRVSANTQRNQQLAQDNTTALRTLVCNVEAAELHQKGLSAERAAYIVRFWNKTLHQIHVTPCDPAT